jgi:hypothetical protein
MLDGMFGGGGGGTNQGEITIDNNDAFREFAQAMRDRMGVYDPWINVGNQSRDRLFDQYGRLVDDPNWIQDEVARGFYESPYQQYMQDMVTKRMNYNATNTGMLGSGAANRALMDELTKMTGQFQNDYINRGMGSYGMGLQGYQGLTDLGFRALGDQTNLLEQAEAAKLKGLMSKNAYDAAYGENESAGWGSTIGTVAGGVIGAYFGGPMGASAGMGIGGAAGGMIDGNKQKPQQGGGGGGGGMGGMGMPNFGSMFGKGGGGGGGGNQPVTDWSATGGRMPQFDTGNLSY